MSRFHAFLCNLLPVQKNKVVLYSAAERYGDNMRYIAEELQRCGGCRVVWVSEEKKLHTPAGIRNVCGRYAMRQELSTAHVIVADDRLIKYWSKGFVKKPGQVYIHARYGSFGIAKKEADIHSITTKEITRQISDSKNLDYLVSNSKFCTNAYRGNYLFCGEYLEYGTPRNDILLQSERSETIRVIKNKYIIPSNARIALYAPARRPWQGARFPKPDYEGILSSLRRRFGGEWVLLLRRHPLLSATKMRWLLPKNMPTVIDAWDYPDTAELLAAADVMIGDYSGCTFDFLLTGRPTFLYTPDADKYEKYIGFYEYPESVPLSQAADNESLLTNIEDFDAAVFSARVSAYLEHCGNAAVGHASSRLCRHILKQVHTPLPPFAPVRRQILKDFIYHEEKTTARCREIYIFGIKANSYTNNADLYSDLPVQKNKILFRTNNRMSYNCNTKYIAQEIIRRNLPYDLVWLVNPNILHYVKDIPPQIRLVMQNSQEAFYEWATAKVWVETNLVSKYIHQGFSKKSNQFWIMTWHAPIDMKEVSKKRGEKLKLWDDIRKVSKFPNYYISGSAFETKHREKMFYAKGRVLQVGHPRNDILMNGNHTLIRRVVCKKIGVPVHKKILLYAPTFREKQHTDCYITNYCDILQACTKKFGGEWVVALRLHYNTSVFWENDIQKLGVYVDVSEYPDMQELLIASDVLITDYSSSVFDFLLLNRPAFLYTSDRERYARETGFVLPPEDTPFPVATDLETLSANITSFDEFVYHQRCEKFRQDKGFMEDGHASERLVDLIEKLAPID